MAEVGDAIPGIAGRGGEVQLVLRLEHQRLGPKLQDGERLEGSRDGKEGERGRHQGCPLLLPQEEFQAPVEIQGLAGD